MQIIFLLFILCFRSVQSCSNPTAAAYWGGFLERWNAVLVSTRCLRAGGHHVPRRTKVPPKTSCTRERESQHRSCALSLREMQQSAKAPFYPCTLTAILTITIKAPRGRQSYFWGPSKPPEVDKATIGVRRINLPFFNAGSMYTRVRK